MAWLNATPKPPEGSRRAKRKDRAPTVTRAEAMKRAKIVPPMPPNPAPALINSLIEIGLTEAAGMGAGPLSWQSVLAWQQVMGIKLRRWEARTIRKLSVEYLAFGRQAESENCPPPWRTKVTERQKEVELDQLRSVLG